MNGHPTRDGWFSAGVVPCDPVPPPRDHPYRLVLLGPPGVGKGTQAVQLGKLLRACHLSTGDLFRSAQCQCAISPAMQQALAASQRGELVPEQLVIGMVRERSGCLQCHGGFLLDGFPRSVPQAEALDAILAELRVTLDGVLCFELPIDQIVERLSGRRTCSQCKAVYHLANQPPKTANVCNHCGSALVQRDDDRPDVVRVRMQVYEEQTSPLIQYYDEAGKLVRVESSGTPEEICWRAIRALHEHLARIEPPQRSPA